MDVWSVCLHLSVLVFVRLHAGVKHTHTHTAPPLSTPLEITDQLDWPWTMGVSTKGPVKPKAVSISHWVCVCVGWGVRIEGRRRGWVGGLAPSQTR